MVVGFWWENEGPLKVTWRVSHEGSRDSPAGGGHGLQGSCADGLRGGSLLARTAQELGLFDLRSDAVSVKVRRRGTSDAEMLWAMVASLARGHGALSDQDALRRDEVACALLDLDGQPDDHLDGKPFAFGAAAGFKNGTLVVPSGLDSLPKKACGQAQGGAASRRLRAGSGGQVRAGSVCRVRHQVRLDGGGQEAAEVQPVTLQGFTNHISQGELK